MHTYKLAVSDIGNDNSMFCYLQWNVDVYGQACLGRPANWLNEHITRFRTTGSFSSKQDSDNQISYFSRPEYNGRHTQGR